MAVLSGKNGTLYIGTDEITPVSNWKLVITSSQREYAANDTAGWKKRVAGAKDCRGSFEVKVTQSGNSPVAEGDPVSLKLHVDNTGNNYYHVEALIGRIATGAPISRGETVALSIEFSGNGAVTPYGVLATGGRG